MVVLTVVLLRTTTERTSWASSLVPTLLLTAALFLLGLSLSLFIACLVVLALILVVLLLALIAGVFVTVTTSLTSFFFLHPSPLIPSISLTGEASVVVLEDVEEHRKSLIDSPSELKIILSG